MKTKNLPEQPTKYIGDYMKTKEENNEIITLNITPPKSDDPLIQLYLDSQKQTVFKTENNSMEKGYKPMKKRDTRYFARLGAKLGEESANRIAEEREKRYKNKQTN